MKKEFWIAFAESVGMLQEYLKHSSKRQKWVSWTNSEEGRDALASYMGYDGLWSKMK